MRPDKKEMLTLLARRQELLRRCQQVDRVAAGYRENSQAMPLHVIEQFAHHDELRIVEREIAKLKEPRR